MSVHAEYIYLSISILDIISDGVDLVVTYKGSHLVYPYDYSIYNIVLLLDRNYIHLLTLLGFIITFPSYSLEASTTSIKPSISTNKPNPYLLDSRQQPAHSFNQEPLYTLVLYCTLLPTHYTYQHINPI